jgi:hypothetical protein
MRAPSHAALGSLSLELVAVAYLTLGEVPGAELRFDSGESATTGLISGHRVLFFDHRRDPQGVARTEIWVPVGAAEGDLACVCVACDASTSARHDGGWDELERLVAGIEVPRAT